MNKNSLATGIILFVMALLLFTFAIFTSDKKDERDELADSAITDLQKQVTPYEAKKLIQESGCCQRF